MTDRKLLEDVRDALKSIARADVGGLQGIEEVLGDYMPNDASKEAVSYLIRRITDRRQIATTTLSHVEAALAEKKDNTPMTDEQIKHMVDRFLQWKLPADFNPDGGVTFDPISSKGTPYERVREPVGTNLLSATQAEAMVRHMVEELPHP